MNITFYTYLMYNYMYTIDSFEIKLIFKFVFMHFYCRTTLSDLTHLSRYLFYVFLMYAFYAEYPHNENEKWYQGV